jgi:hypothetical protein
MADEDDYIILRRSEVEKLVTVLTPLYHCACGDYNKWMHGGGSKEGKMPLAEAQSELKKILPNLRKELDNDP